MTDNKKITLEDLFFYFDSKERDRFDQGKLGQKNAQILSLREKLMRLPMEEFEATIKTISKMVDNYNNIKESDQKEDNKQKELEARELYNKVTSASKPNIDQVPKV